MTLDEAYRRGQRDMRDRIVRQWAGWITHTVGGHWRATRPGRKPISNVALIIRAQCKVIPLAGAAIAKATKGGQK